MPSGELVGTTLKYTTGREVTDGHILISNKNDGNCKNRVLCTRPHAYCKVAEFLDTSFLGLWSVPGRYVPILLLCKGFSLQEATDVLDLTWPHFLLYEGFSLQDALDFWIFPGHIRAR